MLKLKQPSVCLAVVLQEIQQQQLRKNRSIKASAIFVISGCLLHKIVTFATT